MVYIRENDDEFMYYLRRANANWELERFEDALSEYIEALNILLKKEPEFGRLHKGAELFNIGRIYFTSNKFENAVKYIMSAHIEDIISQSGDTPATKFLNVIFKIEQGILDEIKEEIIELVKEKRELIETPSGEKVIFIKDFNPLEFLEDFLRKHKISNFKNLINADLKETHRTKKIDEIPGKYNKRVFIGGSYILAPVSINYLKMIIEELEYVPIIAKEFEMIENEIHKFTLLLLSNCKFAVFDVSQSAGQYLEVERVRDYYNKVLLIYGKNFGKGTEIPPQISKMITSLSCEMEYPLVGFADYDELKTEVNKFLESNN